MVYPAHVIVNFVTSWTFLFTFTKIPSANMAIYSTCTLYKRSFSILCFGLSKFSISYQYSKPIQILCCTKNRLKSAVCMRSTHYALTSAASHFIFVSFPFSVMLFYRQNHNETLYTQMIDSLNIPVSSTFGHFSAMIRRFQRYRQF